MGEDTLSSVLAEEDRHPHLQPLVIDLVCRYLAFKELRACCCVSKQFRSFADRELRSAARKSRPKFFTWLGPKVTLRHLKSAFFQTKARRDLRNKFKAAIDTLPFVPTRAVAVFTGFGKHLMQELVMAIGRRKDMEEVVRKYFVIDVNDLVEVIGVRGCEVVSCSVGTAILTPELSPRHVHELTNFRETKIPAFSCLLFPDIPGVSLHPYHSVPLFRQPSSPLTDLNCRLEFPVDGPEIDIDDVKGALHLGTITNASEKEVMSTLKYNGVKTTYFRGSMTRLSTQPHPDCLEAFRDPGKEMYYQIEQSCGVVFEGEKAVCVLMDLGEYEENRRREIEREMKHAKERLFADPKLRPKSIVAFMSANLEYKLKDDLLMDLEVFGEVFPGVPLMGTMSKNAERLKYRRPISSTMLVGFC